ncbi:MAG TPA: hypothetical protein QF873_03965 [Patescibacteria group bacterium]|nr:hypothetical protein [Patescibacteria group bacterium]
MPFLPTFDDADDQFALEGESSKTNKPQTPDQRVRVAVRALRQMQQQLENILDMLERGEEIGDMGMFSTESMVSGDDGEDRIVEGVFDGERMMGTDGVKYNVPPNYASKSKLVEGDIMKLVIKDDGSFIYKQIGPVERDRVLGKIATDDFGNYAIKTEDGDNYRVLTASVTYFKGEPGDEAIGLTPKGQKAKWAAIENIIST